MPATLEELDQRGHEHGEAIADLRARMVKTEEVLSVFGENFRHINEAIASLREGVARVATKDDIIALRDDMNKNHTQQLRDAHNSTPTKITVFFGFCMLIVAVISVTVTVVGFSRPQIAASVTSSHGTR